MNNCSYGTCGNTKYFVTGIQNNGTQLVLSFNNIPNVIDESFFRFRFSENLTLPSNYSTLPVVATVNINNVATLIPVYDKFGDIMQGSEIILNTKGGICTRYVYRSYQGYLSDSYHLLFSNIPKIERH